MEEKYARAKTKISDLERQVARLSADSNDGRSPGHARSSTSPERHINLSKTPVKAIATAKQWLSNKTASRRRKSVAEGVSPSTSQQNLPRDDENQPVSPSDATISSVVAAASQAPPEITISIEEDGGDNTDGNQPPN